MHILLLLMGLWDLNSALILFAAAGRFEIPLVLLIIFPLGLIAKGFISITDIGCIMDFFSAALILLSIFWLLPPWLLVFAAALLLIKAVRSFGV